MARPLADPERPALRTRLEPLECRALVHVGRVDDQRGRVEALVVLGVGDGRGEQLRDRLARGLRRELQDRGGVRDVRPRIRLTTRRAFIGVRRA